MLDRLILSYKGLLYNGIMLELPIIRLIKLNANSADSDKIPHYVASHLHVPTCMNNFETFF